MGLLERSSRKALLAVCQTPLAVCQTLLAVCQTIDLYLYLYRVYLGAGLLWIILSFSARLLQGIGLGLFPAEYTLEVHWGDTIVPLPVQIVLGVVCLLGFVLFDLVYLAAVINYAIQSEFNIQFVRAICQLVTQKKYSKLDLAIKVVLPWLPQ